MRYQTNHGTSTRTRAAALMSALLLAGCGTAAKQPKTASGGGSARSISTVDTTHAGTTRATTTTRPASHAGTPTRPSPIAFSRCMRANGVTDFPDPTPGKGFGFQLSPTTMASPRFQAAQTKCQKFMPASPLTAHAPPSKQTMAKLLRIATCMRAHGIHQFPDPLYAAPKHLPSPGKYQEITNFDGATLLFPANMDLQAPAYRQALTACGAPPLGLPH